MKISIFTGAGISAEAGIATFRDSGGLWEHHKIEDVATPEAWKRDPKRVLDFYNQRRKQIMSVEPTTAHKLLADLQWNYPLTTIITQNIDDLHERAGSTKVLHLHGEIRKARSTRDQSLVVNIEGWKLELGDKCPLGSQLRPHVVWFGEDVPRMEEAIHVVADTDVLLVIGTSLQVYPAANLIYFVPDHAEKWIIDPNAASMNVKGFRAISKSASAGVQMWLEMMNL